MTPAEKLAEFVVQSSYADQSDYACQQLKIHVLDSLGCAPGSLEADPITQLRQHNQNLGGSEYASLIGGGRTAPDRAAF